jgi:predicted ester cyclase
MTTDGERMSARLDEAIEAWNRAELDAYLTLYDERVTLHGYGPEPMGLEAVRGFYEGIFAGLPGSRLEILDRVAEGDELVVRFVQRGRHDGELMGVAATGRDVELNGITILRFEGDRVIERWSQADMLGLMTQIGAVG